MNHLVRYDAACRALAEAKAVDEVRDIRNQAEAMRLYGRQAKNRQLEADAWQLKIGQRFVWARLSQSRRGRLVSQPVAMVSELGSAKVPSLARRFRKLANDTWGRCVPISILSKDIGLAPPLAPEMREAAE